MAKRVKKAEPSAQPSLREAYRALQKEGETRVAAEKRARARSAAAEEAICERVKNGESTGDPVADHYLKLGYSGNDPCAVSTRALFQNVAQHPGEFFFLHDLASRAGRHGGGISGPQSDQKEFCLFGQLDAKPCEIREAWEAYVRIAVHIPTKTHIKIRDPRYVSWQTPLNHALSREANGPILVHNTRTADPSNWCSVHSGDRDSWSSDFDDLRGATHHESTLLIGDRAVLEYFGAIQAESTDGTPIRRNDDHSLKLFWFATAIKDPMNRSGSLRTARAAARETIAKIFQNRLDTTNVSSLKKSQSERRALEWQVELMKFYGLENEPFFHQAEALLASV